MRVAGISPPLEQCGIVMSIKAAVVETRTREASVQEEMAALGEDDLMDFMNLSSQSTGIDGIIFISTSMGQHGPRVKYFQKAGRDQPSFSISIAVEPLLLSKSRDFPDRISSQMAPLVSEWVRLNREALLKFWNDGAYWPVEQVDEFKVALKKI